MGLCYSSAGLGGEMITFLWQLEKPSFGLLVCQLQRLPAPRGEAGGCPLHVWHPHGWEPPWAHHKPAVNGCREQGGRLHLWQPRARWNHQWDKIHHGFCTDTLNQVWKVHACLLQCWLPQVFWILKSALKDICINQGPETTVYQLSCNLALGSKFCTTRAHSCLVLGYLCNADTHNWAGAAVRSILAPGSRVAFFCRTNKDWSVKGQKVSKG